MVDRLLGKCFRTREELRPGHVVKKLAVIVVVLVDTTGRNADQCRYCIMSDLYDRVLPFIEHRE